MKIMLTLMMLSFLTIPFVQAQSTPEELIDKFFNTYVSEGASIALDELYATNKWMQRKTDAIESLKNKFEDLPSLLGEYYGRDLLLRRS